MKTKGSVIYTIVISMALLITACKQNTEDNQLQNQKESNNMVELTANQIRTASVQLGYIQEKEMNTELVANGILSVPPQQQVSVTVPYGGFVKAITIQEGSEVVKGQCLAILENPEFIQLQQDYLEAVQQAEYTQTDYERQKQLSAENINAQKTLQQAKATYQGWQTKVNGYKAKLKMINIIPDSVHENTLTTHVKIKAPISGYITAIHVNVGEFINYADNLFEVVNTDKVFAKLTIFEQDLTKIKKGQPVKINLQNDTKVRKASVSFIGKSIKEDRSTTVLCQLTENDQSLIPGSYVSATIQTQAHQTYAIHQDGVAEYQGKKYIAQVSSTETTGAIKFNLIEIETGSNKDEFVEIKLPENFNIKSKIAIHGTYAILAMVKNVND
jgi:cobalt-zinc-cadmium efflux system membrane fusion protein